VSGEPAIAAWRHHGSREGFEVARLEAVDGGYRVDGQSAAVQEGEPWAVRYAIELDSGWVTRRVELLGLARSRTLESDGAGRWRIDGAEAPQLEGCVDVDLEASAFTNTLPIRRVKLEAGDAGEARAAWVAARDLETEPFDQLYTRLDDERYDYRAVSSGFRAELLVDDSGLVRRYPGLAERVA
jgi:uncharacterized protein